MNPDVGDAFKVSPPTAYPVSGLVKWSEKILWFVTEEVT
jgi:hypothetical protein